MIIQNENSAGITKTRKGKLVGKCSFLELCVVSVQDSACVVYLVLSRRRYNNVFLLLMYSTSLELAGPSISSFRIPPPSTAHRRAWWAWTGEAVHRLYVFSISPEIITRRILSQWIHHRASWGVDIFWTRDPGFGDLDIAWTGAGKHLV